jgi:hypothetical protein
VSRGRPRGASKSALPKPWSLLKQALVDYRGHWRTAAGIVAVVGVPVAILSNLTGSSGDATISAYLAFAQLCLNVALVYAVIEWLNGRTTGIRQAYYSGSAMLVRLILVSVMLIGMALLLILGLLILGYGVFSTGGSVTAFEEVLLVILAIAVSVPSVILVTRALWALYVIFETPQGPIEAIKASRKLTQGKVRASLGRLVALGLLLVAVLLVPLFIGFLLRTRSWSRGRIALAVGVFVVSLVASPVTLLLVLQTLVHTVVITMVLQIIVTLAVLPLANFYLYRYYQALR